MRLESTEMNIQSEANIAFFSAARFGDLHYFFKSFFSGHLVSIFFEMEAMQFLCPKVLHNHFFGMAAMSFFCNGCVQMSCLDKQGLLRF